MPNKSNTAFKRNLAVEIVVQQFGTFCHYSSNLSARLNSGISLAVTNDFIVDCTVENLVFFLSVKYTALDIFD